MRKWLRRLICNVRLKLTSKVLLWQLHHDPASATIYYQVWAENEKRAFDELSRFEDDGGPVHDETSECIYWYRIYRKAADIKMGQTITMLDRFCGGALLSGDGPAEWLLRATGSSSIT